MKKSKKRFLFLVAGLSVAIVAMLLAIPEDSWYGFKTLLGLPFSGYGNYTPPPPYRGYEAGPKPIAPIVAQDSAVTATNQPAQEKHQPSVSTMDLPSQKMQGEFLGPALYRNDEMGFELSIPEGFRVMENPHHGPFSYFNLSLQRMLDGGLHEDVVDINIATLGFAEMSYRGLKPDDGHITVDGLEGLRYEYDFESRVNIDYIIDRPKDTFLIGGLKDYEGVFDEVVSSLRFFPNKGDGPR